MNIETLLILQHRYKELSDAFGILAIFGDHGKEKFYLSQEQKYEKLFIQITKAIAHYYKRSKT